MDDPFGNMAQPNATYSAFLQPGPYANANDMRRASVVSTATATSHSHDVYPAYGMGSSASASGSNGISPASTNSYQEGYAMPGLSSGGSTNPSVSPRAPHSPFSGSPLSAKSLQASELARLLTTNANAAAAQKAGFVGSLPMGAGQMQAQALSMHVPAGGYDSLITGAGYAYPQISENGGMDNYLVGPDGFATHAHLSMPGGAGGGAANMTPSRADFAWGGVGQPQAGVYVGGYAGSGAVANQPPPSAGFSSFINDRRASVAQSEGAMSTMSDFSNMNVSRGFVGGLMTDEQTGWGAGSGMDGPAAFGQNQQQQQQQGGFADNSFDSAAFGDISEDQLNAFVAENSGYSLPGTGQLDGGFAQQQQAQPMQTHQHQHRASLPGFNTQQTAPPPGGFAFPQQMQFPVLANLAPPTILGAADATRSGSEQSDAELNGVSLAQIAGATAPRKEKKTAATKKVAGDSRRGSVAVIEYNPDEKAQKRAKVLAEKQLNVPVSQENSSASPEEAKAGAGRPRGKRDADNLHNIVEQRYRRNVKGSLDMLRDSVPRLRHLYKTSTPLQASTTDRDLGDGLIGGVRDLGKPTKKTVMEGARLYIVHLERENGSLRRRGELAEGFIRNNWPGAFAEWQKQAQDILNVKQAEADMLIDAEEKRLRSKYGLPSDDDDEADDQDDDGEQEDDARPRKKYRKSSDSEASGKAPKKAKRSTARDLVPKAGSVASSFAVAYTFFPRASNLFTSSTSDSSAMSGSVLLDAPYQAASRSSALLAKALPEKAVPHPDIVMEWFWLIALASILTAVTWIVLERFVIGTAAEREVAAVAEERKREAEIEQAIKDGVTGGDRLKKLLGVGSISSIVSEAINYGLAKIGLGSSSSVSGIEGKAWDSFANAAVGGVTALTRIAKVQLSWSMARHGGPIAKHTALRALLAPRTRASKRLWTDARLLTNGEQDPITNQVVALPLAEASEILRKVQPTNDPLGSIANHLVLIHLNDILSRIYINLVETSIVDVSSTPGTATVATSRSTIAKDLQRDAFICEIQAVLTDTPRGTEGYALGLVLIAIWGLLAGQDVEMQRRVAYMLTIEDMQGVGNNLASVQAVLDMLAPNANAPTAARRGMSKRLTSAAKEVDALALACIQWLTMLNAAGRSSSSQAPSQQWMQVASLELRVLLANPVFHRQFRERPAESDSEDEGEESSTASVDSDGNVDSSNSKGVDEVDEVDLEVEAFDRATERLIDALTVISRSGQIATKAGQ